MEDSYQGEVGSLYTPPERGSLYTATSPPGFAGHGANKPRIVLLGPIRTTGNA